MAGVPIPNINANATSGVTGDNTFNTNIGIGENKRSGLKTKELIALIAIGGFLLVGVSFFK